MLNLRHYQLATISAMNSAALFDQIFARRFFGSRANWHSAVIPS
jgi:hypothetical protein